MDIHQKNLLAFGTGFVLTGLILAPFMKRFNARHRAAMAKIRHDNETMWMAVGAVNERIRNGIYNETDIEDVMTDLEFERIRFANDPNYNKLGRG